MCKDTCIHSSKPGYIDTYKHTWNLMQTDHSCLSVHTYMCTYTDIMHVCLYTHTHLPVTMHVYTHICLATHINTCIHTFILTNIRHSHIHEWIHTCIHTYIPGDSCMLYTHIQTHSYFPTNIHVYIHTFQPRNIYNFRVKCLHNFQICIFLRISILLEIWKKDYSGSEGILQAWHLVYLSLIITFHCFLCN